MAAQALGDNPAFTLRTIQFTCVFLACKMVDQVRVAPRGAGGGGGAHRPPQLLLLGTSRAQWLRPSKAQPEHAPGGSLMLVETAQAGQEAEPAQCWAQDPGSL